MDLQEMKNIIMQNNLTLNSGDSIISTEDILKAIDEISNLPENSFVASDFKSTIEKVVTEFLNRNSEIDLICTSPEFIISLKEWLERIENKINKLKSENNADVNKDKLIHLYYYRKHLKELLKYL